MTEKSNGDIKRKYSNFEDLIFDESFQQFVAGSNNKSIIFWQDWINSNPGEKEDFDKAIKILLVLQHPKKSEIPVNKNESLNELLKQLRSSENNSTRLLQFIKKPWVKIAATIILAFGISYIYNETKNNISADRTRKFCEVIVPIGEKTQLILADGTQIWINSGSNFKYPVNFGEKCRDVYLSGEAYFDVKKQNGKSFVVNTRDVRINVVGTAFDVKCYPDEYRTQTTVVRGLVKVENITGDEKPIYLRPNQMIILNTHKDSKIGSSLPSKVFQQSEIKKVNPDNITCWKDRLLVFSDESLAEMALKMERWYNLKIIISDETLKKERYTGKFINNETILQVLEAIKITTPIKYKITNNEVIITSAK